MATNDITGARLVSKPATKLFRDNFDAIFKPKKAPKMNRDKRTTK